MPSSKKRRSAGISSAGLVLIALLCLAPESARAHGEWLVQIVEVTQRIKAATNNPATLYLERGELHRLNQEWDAAASDYARAAQFDPNLAAVNTCRAKMLDDSGEFEASEALFAQVIARNPHNGDAHIGRARVRMKLDKRDLAIADYNRGLDLLTGLDPEHFLELARAHLEHKDSENAIQALDKGIARLGPRIPLQSLAVDLELERNHPDSALARLDSIIAQSARKEAWLARRGEILMQTEGWHEARQAFNSALTAISLLPWRLQQAPPMQNLSVRVKRALAEIDSKLYTSPVSVERSLEVGPALRAQARLHSTSLNSTESVQNSGKN